jgi:hypothetical protein
MRPPILIINKDTSIPETVHWITKLAIAGSNHPQVIKIANQVKESDKPLETLFDIAYNTLVYKPDEQKKQQPKTIDRMLHDGTGNCVDYVILISSVLFRLGIPHWYVILGYDKDKSNEFHHILIKVNNTLLDPVPGQKQDGTDTRFNRPVKGKFNHMTPHFYKIEYFMPQLEILQGTKPILYQGSVSRTRAKRQLNSFGALGCSELGCSTGCGCGSNLGKTFFGKVFRDIADVAVGTANVLVTPIEGVIKREIISNSALSDSKFGNFVKKSQEVNSKLNKGLANIVSSVFIGGAIKAEDMDAVQKEKINKELNNFMAMKTAELEALTADQKQAIKHVAKQRGRSYLVRKDKAQWMY